MMVLFTSYINHSLLFKASLLCYRYIMDGYEKGIEGPLLDFASKKYCSHRALPIGLAVAQVQIHLAEDKLAKRMRFKKQDKN